MEEFNYKKFLTENKLTTNSNLNEMYVDPDADEVEEVEEEDLDLKLQFEEENLNEMPRTPEPYVLAQDYQDAIAKYLDKDPRDDREEKRGRKGRRLEQADFDKLIDAIDSEGQIYKSGIRDLFQFKRPQQANAFTNALMDLGILKRIDIPKQSVGGTSTSEPTEDSIFTGKGEDDNIRTGRAPEVGVDDKDLSDTGSEDEEWFGDKEKSSPTISYREPEGDEFEKDLGSTAEQLADLKAQKDALLSQYKAGDMSIEDYKLAIGDIPQQIKDLEAKLDGEEDEIFENFDAVKFISEAKLRNSNTKYGSFKQLSSKK